MIRDTRSRWTGLVLGLSATAIVVGALATWLTLGQEEEPPRECGLTPTALHQGTFLNWRLSMSPGEGMSGEVSALIRLDDGREIVAYNVTNAGGLTREDRVTISEIQCVHRRVFLLATPGMSSEPRPPGSDR
ncbi:MAG: hypothetical protein KDJ37_17065 [Hyphomicrobiaceae bacterium]|nr:hypothetical protein [Hyphomicrobiaceae bacterium]